ncbi:MAG: terminase [Acidovorax sp.]|nr:terminase [Acidovorax sp.]
MMARPVVPSTAMMMAKMQTLTAEQRAALDLFLLTANPAIWVPQDGPQSEAYFSQADIVFYGGSAGGGKTDLLLGLSLTVQEHSIIFRREAVQLIGLEERMTKILGTRNGYNGTDHIWRLPGARVLELGSVQLPGDWIKYQGRPHDLKAFDEICHFTEMQFRTLIGWKRTDNPKVRQRVVCAGNPPTEPEGEWVKRFWAPWLDPHHPNPAKFGELRWFVMNEKGEDQEVPGPEPVMVGGELMQPLSRTFIPSSVDDNLFLVSTGYKATLQALPEPLRSQMLRGDFNAGTADPAWQLIPTDWLKAAQARWKPRAAKGVMTALGLDPARGGIDKTCAARRHGQWFDELVSAPGAVTKDGPTTAGFVVPLVRDGAPIAVDGIGIGSSALDFIAGLGLNVHSVIGSEGSTLRDKAGQMRFRNKRAEMYWRLREALDPTAADPIDLPPDAELLADLAAVRYKVVTMGQYAAIQIRSKDEIREVLGRSPDKGDSVAMTFAADIPKPEPKPRAKSWRDRLAASGSEHWDQATA